MITVSGIFYGVSSNPNQTVHFIGIGNEVTDEWGNTNTEVTKVRIPKDQVMSVQAAVSSFKGKQVNVPVYLTAWTGSKGAVPQLNLDTRKTIVIAQAPKAASNG